MSRISISLLDFCRTGHFGPITLGMTKPQVEQVFSKPPDWGGSHPEWSWSKKRKAADFTWPYTAYPIWTYDAIEFHFGTQDRLFLIWCDHFDELVPHRQVFDCNLGSLDPPAAFLKIFA